MLNIYKASAGSGKTYTLALEYIKLILGIQDPETGKYRLNKNPRDIHRHILAITFTVKATEEMKRRIIHEIALIAGKEPNWEKPSEYIPALCDIFGCTKSALVEAAGIALNAILYDYSVFSVNTIDAFFQTILRTFAREAELMGNYDVELDDDSAIVFGVNQMFSSLNEGQTYSTLEEKEMADIRTRQLSEWIFSYIQTKINEGQAFDILNRSSKGHGKMITLIKGMSGEKFKLNYDLMMEYLEDTNRITDFAKALTQRALTIRKDISDNFTLLKNYIDGDAGLVYSKDNKKSTVNNHAWAGITKYANCPPDIKIGATEPKIAADHREFFSKYGKSTDYVNDSHLASLISNAYKTLVDGYSDYLMIEAVGRNLFILGLLERVYTNVRQFSSENNFILLSDTASLLRKIIGEDEIPFVYERIGQEFKHFLIDEFQDTSELQWQNLRPLINESLGTNNSNLIIGDVKQCIYRFRDSDPTLLRDIGLSFPKHANPIKNNLEGNTNWRSANEIVQFNNTLFLNLGRELGHGRIYDSVVQPIPDREKPKHGYVKAVAINAKTEEDFNAVVLERLIDDINIALDNGYPPGDIAILVRRRVEGEALIKHIIDNRDKLHHNDLRVVSDDAMGLADAPIVRMIISILEYIAETFDNDNNPTKADTAAQRIARLINHYEHLLTKFNNETTALNEAIKMVKQYDGKANKSSIDIDVESIIDMTCLSLPSLVERIVAKYLKQNNDSLYIAAFQDVVLDYAERNGSDIRDFLKWWSINGSKTKVAGATDPNAIRVMTIHKAKGLEFKVVIVPFVNTKVPDFRSPEWFIPPDIPFVDNKACIPPMLPIMPSEQIKKIPGFSAQYQQLVDEQTLDELNVTYVAFTRAVEALTIYINPNGKNNLGSHVFRALCESSSDMVEKWLSENTEAKALTTSPLIAVAERILDEDAPSVKVCTIGTYPKYHAVTKTNYTAVDPTRVDAMPPYSSDNRDDLWADTCLDTPAVSRAGERGNAIHAILSRVRNISDLDKAVRDTIHSGIISASDYSTYFNYLSKRLGSQAVKRWFDGYCRVLLERTIANTSETHARLRPDRVVWTADGSIEVIDYKTGKQEESHHNQVRGYIAQLTKMGFSNVKGFIWYLKDDSIIPVA